MASKMRKWSIAIAIAIVFNLFVNYGIATFYPGPEYNDYCDGHREPYVAKPLGVQERQETCPEAPVNETAREQCREKNDYYLSYRYDANGCAAAEYCQTCQSEYNSVRKEHDGNVFAFLLVVAVVALGIGFVSKAEAVSTGFLMAGLLSLIIASIRYWEHLQNVYRFILLGAVLAALVWLGYKKVK